VLPSSVDANEALGVIALVVAEAVAILLLALLVAGLLRSHAEILRSLHELGASPYEDSEAAPSSRPTTSRVEAPDLDAGADVAGSSPDGEAISIGIIGAEHDTLLAFLSSGCSTCAGFWDTFSAADLPVPAGARLVVVTKEADIESISAIRALAPAGVPVVMSNGAWTDYEVPVVPYFVHVRGATGRVVGQGTGVSWDQVVSLMGQAVGDVELPLPGVRKASADADREARADRALLSAGITPGHASLYPGGRPDAVGD
jgi:hypothetical protein